MRQRRRPRLHLHRYGGRTMCGRRLEDVPIHSVHDDAGWSRLFPMFHFDMCRSCRRAEACDNEELMRQEDKP